MLPQLSTAPPTMSSVELVELINAMREPDKAEMRHDHFMAKVERHQGIDAPKFRGVYKGGNGQDRPCFHLPKRECELMVMSESTAVQAKVYDRLATAETSRVDLSKMQILEMAMESERERMALKIELEAAAPAVAFVEKFVDSTGLKGFRQVCKLLNANESEFREFLKDKKIMYPLGGEWAPFSQHLDAGRFAVKAGTSDTNGHAFNSAKFTPKGVNWVAGEWAKYNLEKQIEVTA